MGDYGSLKAIIEEAREIQREEAAKSPVACPYNGEPLEYHAGKGVLHCPFCGWQIPGRPGDVK